MVARIHNVPAQETTLGKRFANAAQELLIAFDRINNLINRYPLCGIEGPISANGDQLDLFDGVYNKIVRLKQSIANHFGFAYSLDNVGQIYPRSLDYEVITTQAQVVAGPSNLAISMRLMVGQELATEGFKLDRQLCLIK